MSKLRENNFFIRATSEPAKKLGLFLENKELQKLKFVKNKIYTPKIMFFNDKAF
jgi:hypothetical protein